MADPLRLYGLKALVLRAGSGVGEASARTLVKHGAAVVAADSPSSGVDRHYEAVRGISGLAANITDSETVGTVVKDAAEGLGGIDILVNEFPIVVDTPLGAESKSLETLLQTRSALILATCRAALPYLKKSPAGRIINMGFIRSLFREDGDGAFGKTEKELASLTRGLAAEVGEFGITANFVQPGGVMTPESREVFRREPKLRDHCIKHSASQRLGEPVDVAKVVLFLASDDSGFVSGTGITVDGGRSR